MSILLVDNNECKPGGHNYIYQQTLNNIKQTCIYEKRKEFRSIRSNPINGFLERKIYLKELLKYNEDIHFLHFDVFYKLPNIIKKLKKNRNIFATLHWYPYKKIDELLLKRSAKYIDIIIVHSDYIKLKLEKMGIKNVEVVNYPAFMTNEYEKILETTQKKTNRLILTCLGATRQDKGLDILIECFQYLDESTKKNVLFNVAGSEEDIKYSYLEKEANIYNVKINKTPRILTDMEYWQNIIKSDVIVLPYRKIFSGNSGPMTDGIFANKFILGPSEGNLGFLIKKYDLGCTFKQEDPKDLAENICTIVNSDISKNNKFKDEITVDNFVKRYKQIYKKYMSNIE